MVRTSSSEPDPPSPAPDREPPLAGRVAVVTGVSRRIGIGAAVSRRLLDDGATVFASGWPAHDAEMPWGEDAEGGAALFPELDRQGDRIAYEIADLEEPEGPDTLLRAALERFGRLDIVVANHARSSHQSLFEVDVRELDRCWAANARASVLLAQSLARLRRPGPGGRLVLFTSGQHKGPMWNEIAYAVTKGAIHQMTASLSDALADRGITVNCINPGPVDTGYAHGAFKRAIAERFPAGRWGAPEDVARLVAWLVGDEGRWVTGQVIDNDGGFRYTPPVEFDRGER
ncbi:MAG: SDR family oxidoreductase [Myxococcota bacterium]